MSCDAHGSGSLISCALAVTEAVERRRAKLLARGPSVRCGCNWTAAAVASCSSKGHLQDGAYWPGGAEDRTQSAGKEENHSPIEKPIPSLPPGSQIRLCGSPEAPQLSRAESRASSPRWQSLTTPHHPPPPPPFSGSLGRGAPVPGSSPWPGGSGRDVPLSVCPHTVAAVCTAQPSHRRLARSAPATKSATGCSGTRKAKGDGHGVRS